MAGFPKGPGRIDAKEECLSRLAAQGFGTPEKGVVKVCISGVEQALNDVEGICRDTYGSEVKLADSCIQRFTSAVWDRDVLEEPVAGEFNRFADKILGTDQMRISQIHLSLSDAMSAAAEAATATSPQPAQPQQPAQPAAQPAQPQQPVQPAPAQPAQPQQPAQPAAQPAAPAAQPIGLEFKGIKEVLNITYLGDLEVKYQDPTSNQEVTTLSALRIAVLTKPAAEKPTDATQVPAWELQKRKWDAVEKSVQESADKFINYLVKRWEINEPGITADKIKADFKSEFDTFHKATTVQAIIVFLKALDLAAKAADTQRFWTIEEYLKLTVGASETLDNLKIGETPLKDINPPKEASDTAGQQKWDAAVTRVKELFDGYIKDYLVPRWRDSTSAYSEEKFQKGIEIGLMVGSGSKTLPYEAEKGEEMIRLLKVYSDTAKSDDPTGTTTRFEGPAFGVKITTEVEGVKERVDVLEKKPLGVIYRGGVASGETNDFFGLLLVDPDPFKIHSISDEVSLMFDTGFAVWRSASWFPQDVSDVKVKKGPDTGIGPAEQSIGIVWEKKKAGKAAVAAGLLDLDSRASLYEPNPNIAMGLQQFSPKYNPRYPDALLGGAFRGYVSLFDDKLRVGGFAAAGWGEFDINILKKDNPFEKEEDGTIEVAPTVSAKPTKGLEIMAQLYVASGRPAGAEERVSATGGTLAAQYDSRPKDAEDKPTGGGFIAAVRGRYYSLPNSESECAGFLSVAYYLTKDIGVSLDLAHSKRTTPASVSPTLPGIGAPPDDLGGGNTSVVGGVVLPGGFKLFGGVAHPSPAVGKGGDVWLAGVQGTL